MPYYTFKIPSKNKNVLSKQFTSQDCIDLHFLLANRDFEGVDLFCQQKFEEYCKDSYKLNCFDKFLYLFSQKILSHTFDTSVVHVVEGSETKMTRNVSLVKIYNLLSDVKINYNYVFSEGDLEINYGIPLNLADKNNFSIYSIRIPSKNIVYNEIDCSDLSSFSFLPVKLYMDLQKMQLENNKLIHSDYFTSNFIRDLTFTNECFLYFLDFIFTENVADYFMLCHNLNKDFNVEYEHIKSITMRELYLLVDTINKNVQDKKKKTSDERAF